MGVGEEETTCRSRALAPFRPIPPPKLTTPLPLVRPIPVAKRAPERAPLAVIPLPPLSGGGGQGGQRVAAAERAAAGRPARRAVAAAATRGAAARHKVGQAHLGLGGFGLLGAALGLGFRARRGFAERRKRGRAAAERRGGRRGELFGLGRRVQGATVGGFLFVHLGGPRRGGGGAPRGWGGHFAGG